jgi:hypothetical protein
MPAPLVVAMYGRSLILASVGRRLESDHHLRLVTLDDASETGLDGLSPDVLLVDLGVTTVPAALALLDERPNTLLVGIDGSGARLLVLSGSRARAMTTKGLVRLMERHATPTPA